MIFADYTRVTTILSPFTGYKVIPSHILQNASERGTRIHDWINCYINSIPMFDEVIDPEQDQKYIDSFLLFWNEHHDLKVTLSEERMFCDDLKITGACDLYCQKGEKRILLDWKTSYKENKTWILQASAYRYLLEKKGHAVDEVWFVKLNKSGKLPKIFNYHNEWDTFLKCYDLYHKFFKGEELQDYE